MLKPMLKTISFALTITTALLHGAANPPGNAYLVHNLVSDQPGVADFTDKNLVNVWGVDTSAASPFWVSDAGTGLSTLYSSNGAVSATVVTISAGAKTTGPAVVTSTLANATGGFPIAAGRNPNFIFCTADGTVSGWNSAVDATHSVVMIDNSANGAVYYGCALNAKAAVTTPLLYVANFRSGAIEVYDTNYKPATLPGNFSDPSVPAGYAPFNIQQYGGKLYVMYAQQSAGKGAWVSGAGLGAVAVFDTNGNLIKHLVTGGPLNAPWGVAIAPANFGAFSGALLIGNFGDGAINAFDATSGASLGALADPQGNPIHILGLWGLIPGNGGSGGDNQAIYFMAGGAQQNHGLLGSIQAAPVVTANAIGNAANTQTSGIAPNTYVSIYGQNLSPVTRNWTNSDFTGGTRLPVSLSGVSVTVNGKAAYVYYISPKQIDVLTPVDTATGPVNVVVTSNGLVSATASSTMASVSPALFLLKDNKSVAAVHENGGVVGATALYAGLSSPAKAGEIISIFATGLGATSPAFGDGVIPAAPLTMAATPTVSFGGSPATVTYAGLVAAGVYQINVVVPAVAAGDVAVTITAGGVTSASNTIVTVQ